MSQEQTRIRDLNDAFRTTFQGGKVTVTATIAAMNEGKQADIFTTVKTFSDFTPDNDPHGEHDFGSFELDGEKFFWKIDYYDPALEYGSEDPSDPLITTRVLTIMLASEY